MWLTARKAVSGTMKIGMATIGSEHKCLTCAAGDKGLRAAEDFLCAGSSSLLLLFAQLHTHFSPFYLLALIPYFCRLLKANAWRSVFLGTTLATSYVFVAYADNLVATPPTFLFQLVIFNFVFVSYGVAVSFARKVYGRTALLLLFLWLPIEYTLNHYGITDQLFTMSNAGSGLILRFSALFHLLVITFAVLLLNPLLLLLASYAVHRILARCESPAAARKKKYHPSIQISVVRPWFYFPDFKSPPGSPSREANCSCKF